MAASLPLEKIAGAAPVSSCQHCTLHSQNIRLFVMRSFPQSPTCFNRRFALDTAASITGSRLQCIKWGERVGAACRYHVWDDSGRQIFKSEPYKVSLTAVAWRPVGDSCAVGMQNRILLCDEAGWVSSAQTNAAGSALSLTWTADGMSCAAACGNGSVLVGDVLDISRESNGLQVPL